jgi:hypothetical protein
MSVTLMPDLLAMALWSRTVHSVLTRAWWLSSAMSFARPGAVMRPTSTVGEHISQIERLCLESTRPEGGFRVSQGRFVTLVRLTLTSLLSTYAEEYPQVRSDYVN